MIERHAARKIMQPGTTLFSINKIHQNLERAKMWYNHLKKEAGWRREHFMLSLAGRAKSSAKAKAIKMKFLNERST